MFFDVGETLVDETRMWAGWADYMGVPRAAFIAALRSVIERGQHHRQVFDVLRPGFGFEAAMRERVAGGTLYRVAADDFYPDALPCLTTLRDRGYFVGIAGNQPQATERELAALDVPADVIASSAGWGVEKPAPSFFARIIEAAAPAAAPSEIAYVGDHLDNDVLPAISAGLVGIFLQRGLWGAIHSHRPEAARAHVRLESLAELLDALTSV